MQLPTRPQTLFAKIKIRRGNKLDLPDLSESEFGFTVDTGEVFIGAPDLPSLENKGRSEPNEEFPYKNVQIITDSQQLARIQKYEYKSNTNYEPQTGQSLSEPTVRSYQNKFDDIVNIEDFITQAQISNDITRAAKEIYKQNFKTIHFPAKEFTLDEVVKLPPNTHLKGEGKDRTILKHSGFDSLGPTHLFEGIDKNFQENLQITTNFGGQPENILIEDMTISIDRDMNMFRWYRSKNITFRNVKFVSESTTDLIVFDRLGIIVKQSDFMFENCEFYHDGDVFRDFDATTYLVKNLKLHNCKFYNITGLMNTDLADVDNIEVSNCYFENILDTLCDFRSGKNIRMINNHHEIPTFDQSKEYIVIGSQFQNFQAFQETFNNPVNYLPYQNDSLSSIIIRIGSNVFTFNDIQIQKNHTVSITPNQTAATILPLFDVDDYFYVVFDYCVKKSNQIQIGTVTLSYDGTNVFVSDTSTSNSQTLLTFSGSQTVIGQNTFMGLAYNTPDDGLTGTLKFQFKATR